MVLRALKSYQYDFLIGPVRNPDEYLKFHLIYGLDYLTLLGFNMEAVKHP